MESDRTAWIGTGRGGEGRYWSDTLHVVSDDILRAMNCGETALWAIVNLSKSFDMVPHGKLIDKLNMYGIDPFWPDDYLRGHTQQVQVKNLEGHSIRSPVRSNSLGVYHGGPLSCILWCIFANDLCLHMPESVKIVQFANDFFIGGRGNEALSAKKTITELWDGRLRGGTLVWFAPTGRSVVSHRVPARTAS